MEMLMVCLVELLTRMMTVPISPSTLDCHHDGELSVNRRYKKGMNMAK